MVLGPISVHSRKGDTGIAQGDSGFYNIFFQVYPPFIYQHRPKPYILLLLREDPSIVQPSAGIQRSASIALPSAGIFAFRNRIIGLFDMFESDSPLQTNASMASSSGKIQGRNALTKKGKEVEILQDLAQSIKYAVDQQGKHVQVLAKAMAGVNEELKLGDALKDLGFTDDEVVLVALKFGEKPQLQITFWSLNENQRRAFAKAIIHS